MEPEVKHAQQVEVRAVKIFGIGEKLIEPGTIPIVSYTRASYLAHLELVERL